MIPPPGRAHGSCDSSRPWAEKSPRRAAEQPEAGPQSNDDTVVDADFEEVKNDKDQK